MPEAAIILKEFKSKLIERHNEKYFYPLMYNKYSISVLQSKALDIKMFKKNKIKNFYRTCISYLEPVE